MGRHVLYFLIASGLVSMALAQSPPTTLSEAPKKLPQGDQYQLNEWGFEPFGFVYREPSARLRRAVKVDFKTLSTKYRDWLVAKYVEAETAKLPEADREEPNKSRFQEKLTKDTVVQFGTQLATIVENLLWDPTIYKFSYFKKEEYPFNAASGFKGSFTYPMPKADFVPSEDVVLDADGKTLLVVLSLQNEKGRYASFLASMMVPRIAINGSTLTVSTELQEVYDSVSHRSEFRLPAGQRVSYPIQMPKKHNMNPPFPLTVKSASVVATKTEKVQRDSDNDPNTPDVEVEINKQYLDFEPRENPFHIVFDLAYEENKWDNSLLSLRFLNTRISTKPLDRQSSIIGDLRIYTSASTLLHKGSFFGGVLLQGNQDATNWALLGQLGFEYRRFRHAGAQLGVPSIKETSSGSRVRPLSARYGRYSDLQLMPRISAALEMVAKERIDKRVGDTDGDGQLNFDPESSSRTRLHMNATLLRIPLGLSVAPKLNPVYLEATADYWYFLDEGDDRRKSEAFGMIGLIIPLRADSGLRIGYSGGANVATGFSRSKGTLEAGLVIPY